MSIAAMGFTLQGPFFAIRRFSWSVLGAAACIA